MNNKLFDIMDKFTAPDLRVVLTDEDYTIIGVSSGTDDGFLYMMTHDIMGEKYDYIQFPDFWIESILESELS